MINQIFLNNLYNVLFEHLDVAIECKNETEKEFLEMIKDDVSITDIRRVDEMWHGNFFDGEETISTFIFFRGCLPEAVIVSSSNSLTEGEMATVDYLHAFFNSENLDVTIVLNETTGQAFLSEQPAFEEQFFEEQFVELILNVNKVGIIH